MCIYSELDRKDFFRRKFVPSRIVESSKEGFKVGDVVKLHTPVYVLCTEIIGDNFSGVVLYDADHYYEVGHYATNWVVNSFDKVSVTIEFT